MEGTKMLHTAPRDCEEGGDQFCVICFEPICGSRDLHLECGHRFHGKCIRKWWAGGKVKCPLCNTVSKAAENSHKIIQRVRAVRLGTKCVFETLEDTIYCAAPDIQTQLQTCPETTVLASSVLEGHIVEDGAFFRTTVDVPNRGKVYCFLPIYEGGHSRYAADIRGSRRCMRFITTSEATHDKQKQLCTCCSSLRLLNRMFGSSNI